jgi:DNA polymerase-1
MTELAIYTERKLMPPVAEVLTAVLEDFPQITATHVWHEYLDRTIPVLVLGAMPPTEPPVYVKALSQKQILAQNASVTELKASLTRLLTPPVYAPLSYAVVDGLTDAEEAALGDVLVVDIETGGNYDKLLPREMYLISVAINDGKHIYVFTEESLQESTERNALAQLRRILTKPGRKLVAHNMKFDFPTLGLILGIILYGHCDTLLLFHSINHGGKDFELKDMCQRLLGAPDWDSGIKVYTKKTHDYASIPRELLYTYNAYDVYWCWHLLKYLTKLADERIRGVALHEFRMSRLFQDVEKNGIGVDIPYLEKLKAEYDEQEIEPLAELRKLAGDEKFNPGSWQQVKKYFAEWSYPLVSTDEKHLMALNLLPDSEPYRFRELLLEHRGIMKMRNTYVHGAQKRMRGNIVYPSFLVHGTITGRLSSRDPNIQNIPRDKKLRAIYVPRAPGRTLVQVDYSQAELRVMACLSGDPDLIAAFQRGVEDFFDAMMPVAFPNEDISSWSPQKYKNNRAKLKACVYGLAYNRQAAAIAEDLKMTVKEAQSIITNFFKRFPRFTEWRQEIEAIALDADRALISPFGRQYQAEVVTYKNRQNVLNSALAFLPQSTASDLCVLGAIEANGRLQSGQYGDTMIVATIHDAILLDVPDEYVDSVSLMVKEAMERAGDEKFNRLVYFAAVPSPGQDWGQCA